MKYEEVIAAWDAQADGANAWTALGEDEKIEFAIEACARELDSAAIKYRNMKDGGYQDKECEELAYCCELNAMFMRERSSAELSAGERREEKP